MSSLDNYRIERDVYLVLWSVAFVVAALELRADWARWSMKRSLNLYHVRQHILQVLAGFLGIVENTDSHMALGVFTQEWQLQFVSTLCTALVLLTQQISCYLLLKSHFTIIQAQPCWLKPAFLSTGIVMSILHVAVGSAGGVSFATSRLTQVDFVIVGVWCALQLVFIDIGFFQIRKVVLLSDKSSATENKLYPQYLKVGRVVFVLNLVILSVVGFMAYSFVLAAHSTQSASPISFKALVRLIALYATLWWTLHPVCPRAKTTSSAVSTQVSSASERPSYQNVSPKVPSRRVSNNPPTTALASLAAREADSTSSESASSESASASSGSAPADSPAAAETSALPVCELAAVSSPAPSEHVIEIVAQS